MILKALYDYYQRSNNLPKKGLELKEIGFLLVIDAAGNFVRFEDRRIDNKHAQEFLVTKSVGRTSAPKANYLYDNSAYVFGYSDNAGDCLKCFKTFKDKITEIYKNNPDNLDIEAVYSFYQKDIDAIHNALQNDPLWNDVVKNLNKKYSNFSFILEGETNIVAEKQELFNVVTDNNNQIRNVCLITGNRAETVETTTATSGLGSKSPAKLVSFQINSGYDSYGKTKGHNAPISEDAEFAYTTALNHLLRADSRNKFSIGNRTFVFWASKENETGKLAEESIWNLMGFKDYNEDDDPNKGIEQVRKVFKSIYSGSLHTSMDDKFYILGLAPNSARIAVTYWAEIPLKDFAERISRHFDDMEIIDGRKDKKPYMGLRSILSTVTMGGKTSDVIPNLPEAVVKSIIYGTPYPQPLFSSCIRRICAESSDKDKNAVQITRASIIKAFLNRINNKEQDIKVMLDKENINQGYLCGRLFAVLDKIQSEANGQHSIKERYMNAASATPAAVFATILNLSSHHSEKLVEGRNIFFEKVKQEIIDKIDANGFPSHLDLQNQGRFFVGYYHQMQSFYIKNENEN